MVGPESGNRQGQEARALSEQEFAPLANDVAREFGTNVINTFYQTVREGRGKQILGTVAGRGDETEIALESNIEHMFVNTCEAKRLPLYIIGEHQSYKTPQSNGIEVKHVAFIDALDNTREFEQGEEGHQGLPAPLWAAEYTYSLDGTPIAGVMPNLKERYMYISVGGKNYRRDVETGEEREIKPSERNSIRDKKFCLAHYDGDPGYALSFYDNFSGVVRALRDANNDAVIQPHTGNFIFGPMAEGTVDAYLMFTEPVSEKLGGWGFAQIAGFKAWEINPENETFREVKHDLKQFIDNPEAYRKGRMSYYLVTRSDNIRDQIIAIIAKDYKEKELVEARLAVGDNHPQEVEIFLANKRASRQQQNPNS